MRNVIEYLAVDVGLYLRIISAYAIVDTKVVTVGIDVLGTKCGDLVFTELTGKGFRACVRSRAIAIVFDISIFEFDVQTGAPIQTMTVTTGLGFAFAKLSDGSFSTIAILHVPLGGVVVVQHQFKTFGANHTLSQKAMASTDIRLGSCTEFTVRSCERRTAQTRLLWMILIVGQTLTVIHAVWDRMLE